MSKSSKFIILLFVSVFVVAFCLFVASGYRGKMINEAKIYALHENIPIEKQSIMASLESGSEVYINGCIDDKTDFYFYVSTKSGYLGYLYDFDLVAEKRFSLPTKTEVIYFLKNPLSGFQCLIMVPELTNKI